MILGFRKPGARTGSKGWRPHRLDAFGRLGAAVQTETRGLVLGSSWCVPIQQHSASKLAIRVKRGATGVSPCKRTESNPTVGWPRKVCTCGVTDPEAVQELGLRRE